MNASTQASRHANLWGAACMVLAMAMFAVEDAFVKAASRTVPVGQILMLFGLGGTVVFACLARLQREVLFAPEVIGRVMAARSIFEISGRLFYGLAVVLTPLSSATMILQATPIVVVAGAALFFAERVGWRRWAAILVGLAGVVVILRPGVDSFSALSLLAVFGMLGFAGRDLLSRAAPASLSARVLGFYGFISIILAGVGYTLWEGRALIWPGTPAALYVTGAVAAGVVAYLSLMTAMRTGEIAAVTPFRYTRLLFGIGLGVLVFGEKIDPAMIVGAGLIVVSGLFILWRGQARPKDPR